jgi:hypothetical protein
VLDISGCLEITDTTLEVVARATRSHLRVLKASCTMITDKGIRALAHVCPRLHNIDASGCSAITDAALQSLAYSCSRLVAIDVSQCMSIGAGSVKALCDRADKLQDLRSINFIGCAVTREGVAMIERAFPQRLRIVYGEAD